MMLVKQKLIFFVTLSLSKTLKNSANSVLTADGSRGSVNDVETQEDLQTEL